MRRTSADGKALKRPLGLSGRFSLLVAALLAVLAVQITATSVATRNVEINRNIVFNAARLTEFAASQAALTAGAGDLSALQTEVERLVAAEAILAAEIRNAEGFTLVRAGPPLSVAPALSEGSRLEVAIEGEAVLARAPIALPAGGAELRLEFASAALRPARPSSILPSVAFPMVLICLAALLSVIAVRRALRPLLTLTAFAEQVSTHRLTERLDVRTNDEFQTLAGAFNHMMDRLEASVRRMRKLAFVDPVTELPNQDRFLRDVRACLETLNALGPANARLAAVLVISIDKLNQLAESYGQEATQELLAMVGQRVADGVRAADRAIRKNESVEQPSLCARLDGPEFGVLSPDLSGAADAGRIAQLLVSAVVQPVVWRGQKLQLDAAAGIALVPKDAADADGALRQARLALKAARRDSRPVRFFTRSLDREAVARVTLEREMREGLDRGQFRAFFQPKVNLADGRIVGAEALARWVRQDGAVVGPGAFIPAAEQNGLISDIAEAILRDACWKAAAWEREGHPIHVAVNVSALQFADDRFAQRVLSALDVSGLSCGSLEIEITESVAMTDPDRVARMIAPLREAGVRFAIDDFGTGHSSLAALSRLPFDVIKIDQQFVRGLANDRHAPAIIETILAMAASLNFRTVAEGVETEEEAAFLRLRGCEIGQGFLFGAAMHSAELVERLRAAAAARPQGAPRADHAAA